MHAVVTTYLASADYQQHRPRSRYDYRRTLDAFRADFGTLPASVMDEPWIEDLRAAYSAAPIA